MRADFRYQIYKPGNRQSTEPARAQIKDLGFHLATLF